MGKWMPLFRIPLTNQYLWKYFDDVIETSRFERGSSIVKTIPLKCVTCEPHKENMWGNTRERNIGYICHTCKIEVP